MQGWYAKQTPERRREISRRNSAARRVLLAARRDAGLCADCGGGPLATRDGRTLRTCEACRQAWNLYRRAERA